MKTKSKKQLVAAIVAGLTLATAAPAFAANPFVDVPAKHWAYDSVSKLAAAGIVDGYGDGTFRGDRTMTRYEMAQIVAKAMARSDKANAEQKAMIDKLAQEFDDELKSLGVRVSSLEKKIGNITWTGQARAWYDWTDEAPGDNTNLKTRILLWATAPLTDDMKFIGRFSSESNWGETNANWVGSEFDMDNAYIQGKHFTFGRQPITLGKGLIYNIGYNNDGATYTVGKDTDKLKLTVAGFKSVAAKNYTLGATRGALDPWLGVANDVVDLIHPYHHFPELSSVGYELGDIKAPNVFAANLTYQASKDLDLSLAYAKSKAQDGSITARVDGPGPLWDHEVTLPLHGDILDTWALGFTYKGMKNVTVTGEYGQNKSDLAKALNFASTLDYDDAKAWVAQLKYKGAQWDKPNTYGLWVGYRDADPGFLGITGDPLWETAYGIAPMNNVKGFEYGFDYTLFKNGVFTFNYMDLESNDTVAFNAPWGAAYNFKKDLKSMTAQLRYFF